MRKNIIFTIGGTIDPILKTIADYLPEKCFFICSKLSESGIKEIIEISRQLNQDINFDYETFIVESENNLMNCYETSLQAIDSAMSSKKEMEVYVDYTGGTKNMSVALALASISKGITFVYVGGEYRSKDGLGIVKPSHEIIFATIDPFSKYAIDEVKKIESFFNKGMYKSSKDLAEIYLEKREAKFHEEVKFVMSLSAALEHWTALRYNALAPAWNTVFNNTDISLLKIEIKNKETVLRFYKEYFQKCHDKIVSTLVNDIILSSTKCAELGRYDEGILRLYRTLEFVGQSEFMNEFKCDCSDVNISFLIDKGIPGNVVEEIKRKFFNDRSKKIQIPLTQTFRLLNMISNKKGIEYESDWKIMKNFQDLRNKSILAHGTESRNKKEFEDSLNLIGNFCGKKIEIPILQIRFKDV